jgi:probable HAF family extracellular repeat protein
MRLSWAALVLTLLASVLTRTTIPLRAADSFSFTTIDAPGAAATYAFGINGAGQIVGFFREAGKKGHGFLRTATGAFTAIDVPGAAATYAAKINSAGQIVGIFIDARSKFHGFVRAVTGAVTTIDVPGAIGTFAQGINSAGQIVGAYTKPDSALTEPDSGVQAFFPHGFLRTAAGALTTFSVPGATNTTAINRAGQVVGTFADGRGEFHGFLRAATGAFTTIDVPGAIGTHAFDINDSGQIVGFFGGEIKGHGFLRAATGVFTTIDVPGAVQTHALGMSDSGRIVGAFEDAGGNFHGFVATR